MFAYIHIPFCENKCKYCRFASTWISQKDKIEKYLSKLLFDINNYDKKINRLESIYFWWWTPSILSLNQLEKIIITLKNKFWFDKNIEITLETTPNNITESNLIWWKKLWFNRLSIWVQTLNNQSLLEIWRGNKGDIIDSLELIKRILFNNISLDFIIGLPYVKKWEIKNDIEFILDNYNFIKHISVYMLEEYYYPWKWKKISINEEDYLWEYIQIKNLLKSRWFNKYEVSNFAKTLYECKHNKAYWNHSEVLAFWLWAHWFIDWIRYSYPDNFKDYYDWKIIIEDKLQEDDIFLEKIMFLFRTNWLSSDLYLQLNQEKLYYFIDNSYLKIENNILKLEDKWVLVLDYILSELI